MNGRSASNIVRWTCRCRADVNNSGAVDSRDFFDFVTKFLAGHADFNRDGSVDSQDFFDFLAAFFGGCA